MSITQQYSAYCSDLSYSDLPEEVVEQVKDLVLDTFGLVVGADEHAASSDVFLDGVRSLDAGSDGATILSTGEQMSAAYTALVNGAFAHSLDYDDSHQAGGVHPAAVVVPAAVAAGERSGASGEDLITGIVAGYDVMCRLGRAIDVRAHTARGFHPTGTCGVFGATAAIGSVLGFDAGRFGAAFGLNGSQAAGSLQFLENGAWNKRAHPGLAAHSAMVSASLADAGFVGAAEPVEGGRGFLQGYSGNPIPEAATATLGEQFEVLETGIKPYPCCRYMHLAMDLLFELAREERVHSEDVDAVTVELPSPAVDIVGAPESGRPTSFVDAQFDMHFGAALVLTRREAGIEAFSGALEGGTSEEVRRVMDATTVTSTEELDEDFPELWRASVAVETTAGRYTASGTHARGDPENPLSRADLTDKFEELTAGLDTRTRDELHERILDLENVGVDELVEPLRTA